MKKQQYPFLLISLVFCAFSNIKIITNAPQTEEKVYYVEVEDTFSPEPFGFNLSILDTIDFSSLEKYTDFLNPSFEEDSPHRSKKPAQWVNCIDYVANSPVDIHGRGAKFFEVTETAKDGNNFIGMVARTDRSFEVMSQLLPKALEGGKSYFFKVHLCAAKAYISMSRHSRQEENFNEILKLRVFASHYPCDSGKLIAQSDWINSSEWEAYTVHFDLEEGEQYEYIRVQTFYDNEEEPCNGNILLDDFSPIYTK